jgi:protein involved in polysaccharide export with SLBB domain
MKYWILSDNEQERQDQMDDLKRQAIIATPHELSEGTSAVVMLASYGPDSESRLAEVANTTMAEESVKMAARVEIEKIKKGYI